MDIIGNYLTNLPELHFHLIVLSVVYIITWGYCLVPGKKFLIDDEDGLNKFSDKWDDKNQKLINSYKLKDKEYGNNQFNRALGFPACFLRWGRLMFGRKYAKVGTNKKGHEVYGYVQDPWRHHLLSFLMHFVNIFLVYFALSKLVGPSLAFMTSLMFAVHPISCQTVAWISGFGYLFCLLWTMANLNVILSVDTLLVQLGSTSFLQILATSGLFAGAFNFIVYAFLGYWWVALLSLILFFVSLAYQGRAIVGIRKKEFEKQNMAASTFFRPSKVFYMVKTVWYYMKLICFPKRLGLFHKDYYHHNEFVERPTRDFWFGLLAIAGTVVLFLNSPFPVQFGIVWYYTYLIVFSNFMTAQQAVVDRYGFIPTLGICLIFCYFLQPYPILFAFICGVLMMRTLVHLPTFNNLPIFYASNWFNFPTSEVALGNLGVTMMHEGKAGSAVDIWLEGRKLNPKYDVNLYNLYSIFRSNKQNQMAVSYLKECLNAKVVHFNEQWAKELEQVEIQVYLEKPVKEHLKHINKSMEVFRENN